MRRKDREVTDTEEIKKMIEVCKTCHLAMVDEGMPYVVPLSFGYEIDEHTLTLFFHSAKEGRKINLLHKNSGVCFAISNEGEFIFDKDTPCNSGYYFSSVLGFGNVEFVEEVEEQCRALTLLMKHQANIELEFTPVQADTICIYKVVSTDFTGKKKSCPTKS